ncbi:MAG: N,N-dimethylformamidase beta subunit family domain-containing protein [Caulobacteraceae bacterium]
MIACYTDRTSLEPGESFRLFASAAETRCRLEVARLGASRQVTFTKEAVQIGRHATADGADRKGCGWPSCLQLQVGADWSSGYYDVALFDQAGGEAHHFIVVRPAPDAPRARAAIILSTNTWHAYNWWGGANAYADVAGLMDRRLDLAAAMEGALGELSTQRPFPPMLIHPPADVPRLVNKRRRGFRERPFASDPNWPRRRERSPYDSAAGFVHKWEHRFVQWAEGRNLALDYFTDFDLESGPECLEPYACVILVGHSEYWSALQRDALETFVDGGGGLAIFSGNTAFWKVRWEEAGKRLICRKWKGLTDDDRDKIEPEFATHLWSHPAFGRPEAELTGLSFLFGGYHRLGLCVARGAGGYTVYDEHHWALEGADLFFGDVIGAEIPLIGYENDGCRFRFAADGRLKAEPILGVPADLEIIAIAPVAFAEEEGRGYRPLIPPEKLDVILSEVFGDHSIQARRRLLHGHAAMAAFRRGKGEVFNAGTTEWAHGLAAGDPFVERITLNVLSRFGGI